MSYPVRYSKGQLKIQEMAFALIAIMIFFVIAAVFFLNFRLSNIKENASLQRDDKASEMALKLADSPEFAWSSNNNKCENCIDLDKIMALKERISSNSSYKNFWGSDINVIRIDILYPKKNGECTRANYPNCRTITLINNTANSGYRFMGGYAALCRQDLNLGNIKCEIGQIYISAKPL